MTMKVVGSLRPSHKSIANTIVEKIVDRFAGSYVQRDQYMPNRQADLLVQWGFRSTRPLLQAVDMKIPFVIVDMGNFDAFGRERRHSISINGFHGLSMRYAGVFDLPPRPHPPIQDWREDGKTVYVYGQMPLDASLRGMDVDAWMHRAASEAIDAFGMPVVKRPHPRTLNPWEPALAAIERTFDDAHVAVTYTSTAGVNAALAGVPVVAYHPGNAAWPVAVHNMCRQRMPGRQGWAHELSWRDYNLLDDAEADAAVEYILKAYPQAKREAAAGKIDREGVR